MHRSAFEMEVDRGRVSNILSVCACSAKGKTCVLSLISISTGVVEEEAHECRLPQNDCSRKLWGLVAVAKRLIRAEDKDQEARLGRDGDRCLLAMLEENL